MNIHTLDSVGHQSRNAEVPRESDLATIRGSLTVHSPCCSGVAAAGRPRACLGISQSPRDGEEFRTRKKNLELLKAIATSKVFTEFGRAFTQVTRLPVALRPVESFQLSCHDQRQQVPFCALMSRESRTCGVCLQSQAQVAQAAGEKPHTGFCHAGLCETAVPLRLGSRLMGYLWTGQVFLRKPSELQFRRTINLFTSWGVNLDPGSLRTAYFETRVLSREQHAAAVKLLTIFAEHLATLSNQILIQRENAEPPMITRAINFIREHHAEALSLSKVARVANASPCYFCKLFKRTTGLNFTNFLTRVRIESSKRLLLNPQLRVSDVAFEAGFQSLSHFNRVFQHVLGQSPTEYRLKLRRIV